MNPFGWVMVVYFVVGGGGWIGDFNISQSGDALRNLLRMSLCKHRRLRIGNDCSHLRVYGSHCVLHIVFPCWCFR